MSFEELHRQNHDYEIIRNRLRNPANAVVDEGINLRRTRDGPVPLKRLLPGPSMPSLPVQEVSWWTGRITPMMILRNVAVFYFGHSADDGVVQLRGKARTRVYYRARQVYSYMCFKLIPEITCGVVARLIHKDHTTILYSRGKVAKMLAAGDDICDDILVVEELIYGGSVVSSISSVSECDVSQAEVDAGNEGPGDVQEPCVHVLDQRSDSQLVAAAIKALPPIALDPGPVQLDFDLLATGPKAA